MKVVQINATCGVGSTGKICVALSDLLTQNGIENKVYYSLYSSSHPNGIKYSNMPYEKLQALKSRILGNGGFNSHLATLRLLRMIRKEKPDIIHLHNIHSHDVNLRILFNYIRNNHIKIFWTFHDCWAFTANCTHFTYVNCSQWKTECRNCPQIGLTSWLFDNSCRLFNSKKELFSGLDLTIITPSEWMKSMVEKSFLKGYPTIVINNGIDLQVFNPIKSSIRKKLGILKNEYMILGVSFGWSIYKGIDVFEKLAESLPHNFKIVLVGTDDAVDRILPKNIISIHRTSNQTELAKLYSAADVFVNATREENFPTVHLEALACGTPVVSFDTGGCKEMLSANSGCVVPTNDIEQLQAKIMDVCVNKVFKSEDCIKQSKRYDKDSAYEKYLQLYRGLTLD